jgi:hypothetical protein
MAASQHAAEASKPEGQSDAPSWEAVMVLHPTKLIRPPIAPPKRPTKPKPKKG